MSALVSPLELRSDGFIATLPESRGTDGLFTFMSFLCSIHDVHGPPSAVADASNAHEAKQVLCAEPRGELLKKTLEARLRWSFQRGHAAASSVCCGGWGSHPHAPARRS